MNGTTRLSLPEGWSDIKKRVSEVLDDSDGVFSQNSVALVRSALTPDALDGKLNRDELRLAFEELIAGNHASADAAKITLAMAQVLPIDDHMFFARHPGLWQKCAEAAAAMPLQYSERSRILQEDLLYSFYRDAVFSVELESGVEAALQVIASDRFFASCDLGRRVAQNALLALVRERLGDRPQDLPQVLDKFPDMTALRRKVEKLLKGSKGSAPGTG